MARASDPGKPSRQPAVLGTREGSCSSSTVLPPLSRTGTRSQPRLSRGGSACRSRLPAILLTATTFQGTLTSATLSLCPRQDMETHVPPAQKQFLNWTRQKVKQSLQKGNTESFRTSSLPCPPVNTSIPRVRKAQTSPSYLSHILPGHWK